MDNAGGNVPDAVAPYTFYTFSAAHECAQAWAGLASTTTAWLWDGQLWRFYS